MSNRCTLAQLREMTSEQAAVLPVDQLAMLLEDVSAAKADIKSLDDLLGQAMFARYAERAADLRRAKETDTGTVSVQDGDYVIKCDLPKKVDWDDDALADVEAKLRDMGEDPAEYVVVKRSVREAAYNGWPSSLRSMFEPARTVSAGKATFKVEPAKGAKKSAGWRAA